MMGFDSNLNARKLIRLKGYDYSQAGAYFITICTHNRKRLFGQVVGAGSKPVVGDGSEYTVGMGCKPVVGAGSEYPVGMGCKQVVGAGSKPALSYMELNEYGRIVKDTWDDLPCHIKDIQLDAFCIMPNHVHGIIFIIRDDNRNGRVWNPVKDGRVWNPPLRGAKPCGLPEMVRQFKTFSARRINQNRSTPGLPIWQRNYYEHIIRNDEELNGFREYINFNPMNWETDDEFESTGYNVLLHKNKGGLS
jgi:putative transposase